MTERPPGWAGGETTTECNDKSDRGVQEEEPDVLLTRASGVMSLRAYRASGMGKGLRHWSHGGRRPSAFGDGGAEGKPAQKGEVWCRKPHMPG